MKEGTICLRCVRRDCLHVTAPRPATLPPRYLEVTKLIADGKQSKEIARELGISANTVREYLTDIYQRIGIARETGGSSRVQLASWWWRNQRLLGDGGGRAA